MASMASVSDPLPRDLAQAIQARVGILSIDCAEEGRIKDALVAAAGRRQILAWTITNGVVIRMTPGEEAAARTAARARYTSAHTEYLKKLEAARASRSACTAQQPIEELPMLWKPLPPSEGSMGPEYLQPDQILAALPKLNRQFTIREGAATLYPWIIIQDIGEFLSEQPLVKRALRDVTADLRKESATVIMIDPVRVRMPPGLGIEVIPVSFPLPDAPEIERLLRAIIERIIKADPETSPFRMSLETYLLPAGMKSLIRACTGLSRSEIRNHLMISIVSLQSDQTQSLIAILQREKVKIISSGGLLEFFPSANLGEIGGMPDLKEWINMRVDAFTDEAREFGVQVPKGLLLLGVPGCGKSACAKAIAGALDFALLRMDVGRLFGGIVGQSEENVRSTLKLAEALSPCVLWLDEIEKSLAGASNGGSSDGGTMMRVFSTILTWMNEKTAPVFIVATANDISRLPPELLRKGRFDEIFFVDLPNPEEREEILKIHLKKKGRDPAQFDLVSVVNATEAFSGSELETLIVEGLVTAFAARKIGSPPLLQTEHLLDCANKTRPLSKTMADKITAMQRFAEGSARRATPIWKSAPTAASFNEVPMIASYQSEDF